MVLLALLAGGCIKPPPPPPPIYLIVIDTLRADALSCYGGQRPTPALDKFAANAVLFEQCFAPSSWTVPSVASIWTGLYPYHHGTTKALIDQGRVVSQETLSGGYTTMAEMLKASGYRTYGISANGHIAETYGFAQGFDQFVGHNFMPKANVASSWAGLAPRVVAEQRFGQPTFVMLFYFDPHHPYSPQEPWATKYCPDWGEKADRLLGDEMVNLVREDYFRKHPDKIPIARALYDSEVAALDAHLEMVLRELPGYDDAWVIIVADHGESFGEVGKMLHGNNLRQPEVHVPLMIKLPHNQLAGTRIATPVSSIDLLPTLAELVKVAQPPKSDGQSLIALLMNGGRTATPRALFAHIDVPWTYQRAMLRWPFKIILERGQDPVVYDLSADPGETKNLRQAKAAEATAWIREADEATRNNIRFPPRRISGEMSDEARNKLRELGYLQ